MCARGESFEPPEEGAVAAKHLNTAPCSCVPRHMFALALLRGRGVWEKGLDVRKLATIFSLPQPRSNQHVKLRGMCPGTMHRPPPPPAGASRHFLTYEPYGGEGLGKGLLTNLLTSSTGNTNRGGTLTTRRNLMLSAITAYCNVHPTKMSAIRCRRRGNGHELDEVPRKNQEKKSVKMASLRG